MLIFYIDRILTNMCRPKKEYTEEELIEKKRLANKKYRQSQKGKISQKKATYKYQQKDKFKEYRKRYYDNIKNEKTFTLSHSTRENKKYMVINGNGKKIHFGGKGNGDFLIYSEIDDEIALKKKRAYIKRHKELKESWTDYTTAGFWAKNILWNKPTLQESVENIANKYKLKITINIKWNDPMDPDPEDYAYENAGY